MLALAILATAALAAIVLYLLFWAVVTVVAGGGMFVAISLGFARGIKERRENAERERLRPETCEALENRQRELKQMTDPAILKEIADRAAREVRLEASDWS